MAGHLCAGVARGEDANQLVLNDKKFTPADTVGSLFVKSLGVEYLRGEPLFTSNCTIKVHQEAG